MIVLVVPACTNVLPGMIFAAKTKKLMRNRGRRLINGQTGKKRCFLKTDCCSRQKILKQNGTLSNAYKS